MHRVGGKGFCRIEGVMGGLFGKRMACSADRPRFLRSEDGQATVEYLIVGVMVMLVVVALAAMWHLASDGVFARHATSAASHAVDSVDLGVIGDVFLY